MKDKKVKVRIGDKELGFRPDPGNEYHEQFVEVMKQIAANGPKSIQEFFCQLVELQRRRNAPMIKQIVKKGKAKHK
jgi:hypothetical protein